MQSKRYHIVIASLVFAALMWGSVNLGDEYQISLDIPVTVQNLPEGRALKGSIPTSVAIKLKGTGWRVVSLLFSGVPQCVLDVSRLQGSSAVLTKAQLIDNITATLSLQIVDVNVDTLSLGFDRYVERKVRLVPNIVVECPETYGVIGDIRIKPDSIVIAGAESVIRDLHSWRTERRVFSRVREPFSAEVPLEESRNYSYRILQKRSEVFVNVQPFAEKTLVGVPVEAVSVPPTREIIFIPPKIDIVVRGGIDQLTALGLADFHVSVDYQVLISDTTGIVQPQIESPSGIRLLVRRPERLQYIIRKRL